MSVDLVARSNEPCSEGGTSGNNCRGSKMPEIADDHRTIDPVTLMPRKLAISATVGFSDSSLRKVLAWLREEQNLVILLEKHAPAETGVSLGEPISDRLDDALKFLLLNGLSSLGLAWYFEDDILHVSSSKVAE